MAKLTMVFVGVAASLALAQPATATDNEARNAANNEVVFKNYPARALAAREQGSVIFRVKLDRDGHPTECVVTGSSGHPLLDNETCNLILLHAEFKRMKDKDGRFVSPTLEGAVNWKLPGGPATSGKVFAASESSDLDKMICKRELETGSLTRYRRTCMTKREWRAASDEMKAPYDEVQGRYGSTHGG